MDTATVPSRSTLSNARLWLRYACRSLLRAPVFSLTVIVTMALGMGCVMSTFGLVNAIFLRPIAVAQPDALVKIAGRQRNGREQTLPSTLLDTLTGTGLFSAACGVNTSGITMEVSNAPRPGVAMIVSGGCFDALGVKAALGRLIGPADDSPTAPRVAVLSHAAWTNVFNRRPETLGTVVRIEGVPFTIVGVTEPAFTGVLLGFPPAVTIAGGQEPDPETGGSVAARRGYATYWILARRQPGITFAQTESRLTTLWSGLLEAAAPPTLSPNQRKHLLSAALSMTPGAHGLDYMLRDRFRRPLTLLFAVAGLILVIACVNAAGLFLVRSAGRQRETALRLALGATTGQVAAPLVAEVLVLLVLAAGAAALLANAAVLRVMPLLGAVFTNFSLELTPDLRSFAVALGTIALAAFFCAVVPAWRLRATPLAELMQGGGRSVTTTSAGMRRTLIVGQVGITVVLIGTASTFVQHLRHLSTIPLGYDPDAVVALNLSPASGGYQGAALEPYYRDLLVRVGAIAGVRGAALSHVTPLQGTASPEMVSAGPAPADPRNAITADLYHVTEQALDVLRLPLLEGRGFSSRGRGDGGAGGDGGGGGEGRTQEALVTESLATRLFPQRNAVGQAIRVGPRADASVLRIVGIVRNCRLSDVHVADTMVVFRPFWDLPSIQQGWPTLLVRVDGSPDAVIPVLRNEVQAAGREYPQVIRTLSDEKSTQLYQERLLASVSSLLGLVGMIMMAVSLYGLLSHHVTSRMREIGVRVALGAATPGVLWLVVKESLWLVSAGALIGLPLTFTAVSWVSRLLARPNATNALALAVTVGVLLLTALLAAWVPCVRATRIDPATVLRAE